MKLLHRIYDKTFEVARGERALYALIFVAFFGSTVFPLPTEIVMIPMILASPKRALYLSTVALVASILGGISGYCLGAFAYDTVGAWIIEGLGLSESFVEFKRLYSEWDWWIVFAGGLTPFPYKVICIASGVVGMGIAPFITASIVSRAMRYYFIAWLLAKYGDRANRFIKNRLELLSIIAFILILAFFLAFRHI
jgi:membrane protein YqaA with SNARE-associated domain